MTVRVETLSGAALLAALPALARLRIEVFRAFPYLYDGDEAYEEAYLKTFLEGRHATVIAATQDGEMIGCATASALETAHVEMIAPLRAAGRNIAEIFYFGESVLLPAYRGQGLGHAFFDGREAAARSHGYRAACFCAVMRPEDHKLRPADYRPLDGFWEARGYRKLKGVMTDFSWKEIEMAEETMHKMQFWFRQL